MRHARERLAWRTRHGLIHRALRLDAGDVVLDDLLDHRPGQLADDGVRRGVVDSYHRGII